MMFFKTCDKLFLVTCGIIASLHTTALAHGHNKNTLWQNCLMSLGFSGLAFITGCQDGSAPNSSPKALPKAPAGIYVTPGEFTTDKGFNIPGTPNPGTSLKEVIVIYEVDPTHTGDNQFRLVSKDFVANDSSEEAKWEEIYTRFSTLLKGGGTYGIGIGYAIGDVESALVGVGAKDAQNLTQYGKIPGEEGKELVSTTLQNNRKELNSFLVHGKLKWVDTKINTATPTPKGSPNP